MSKQYNIFVLLSVFLATNIECSSLEKVQDQAINYAFNVALFSGISYLIGKATAKSQENCLPDASPHFQKWARKILAENGLQNADSIPLKMGKGSCVIGGSFIQIDSRCVDRLEDILAGRSIYSDEKQKRIRAHVEKILLHEKKHYYNGDFGKTCLLFGATTALGFQVITGNDFITSTIKNGSLVHGGALLTGVMCATVGSVPYIRYQEKEADRSAFMNISSLEKLEINKRILEEHAQAFETNLLKNPLSGERNWLERKVRPMIADQWHTLSAGVATASHEEVVKIQLKQRSLIEVADFISDWEHSSYRSAIELAQECLDKRKAIHQKNFKSSVSAVLRVQGIKQ